MHQLGGEAGRRVELGDLAPRPGAHPGLLLELARGGDLGILDGAVIGHVQRPGGDLEQGLADRDPILADEQDTVLLVDGEDRDRARVSGDLARPREPSARSMVSTWKVR